MKNQYASDILDDLPETKQEKVFTREPVSENVEMLLQDAKRIELELLPQLFSICKVTDYSGLDMDQPFVFTGRTDEEKSLVCPVEFVPANTVRRDDGWRAFRIRGELDFSLIGILAGISGVLAAEKIGIFAVSTYNTDYILVKEENCGRAVESLAKAGYRILG